VIRHATQRRGIVLIIVVIFMIIVGGLLTVLAMRAAQWHRQREYDRTQVLAGTLARSGIAWAQARLGSSASRPAEPVVIDVSALVPPGMSGSAVATFPQAGGRTVCRVTAEASTASGAYAARAAADCEAKPSP
jgi:Tfp pilus assembly protein PilX